MNHSALTRIKTIFERYCFGHHFYLEDFRTGEQYEAGESRRYPIGSCFKLAVLVALFEKIDRESTDIRHRFEVKQNANYRGASILAPLSGPTKMSWLDLAQLMMSISDGLATDLIIEWVGLTEVNNVLWRYAPNSGLPLNLDDMVKRVEAVPGFQLVKHRRWTKPEAVAFLTEIAEFGFTNAVDLATLAKSTCLLHFNSASLADFELTLRVKRYVPRTEMFYGPDVQCITKTGSLIKRYFMNDCGVFFDVARQKPIACFGYCSHGWRLPSLTCDAVGGLIGLEIAKAIGLDPIPNADWSVETEQLFLTGID